MGMNIVDPVLSTTPMKGDSYSYNNSAIEKTK
jgi:hypothetical protein